MYNMTKMIYHFSRESSKGPLQRDHTNQVDTHLPKLNNRFNFNIIQCIDCDCKGHCLFEPKIRNLLFSVCLPDTNGAHGTECSLSTLCSLSVCEGVCVCAEMFMDSPVDRVSHCQIFHPMD